MNGVMAIFLHITYFCNSVKFIYIFINKNIIESKTLINISLSFKNDFFI